MRAKNTNIINIFIIFIGLVILYIGNLNGIGKTNDSVMYMEGAECLNSYFNSGTEINNCSIFGIKPPLFSFILSVIGTASISVMLLNAICYFITMLISFSFINREIKDIFYASVTKTLIAIGTPILLIHLHYWTEPLFISLVLLSIYVASIQLNKALSLFLIFITATMALLTRHIGIVISSSIFIALIFQPKKYWHILIALVLANLVYVFWIINAANTFPNPDTFAYTNNLSLLTNLNIIFSGVGNWFVPSKGWLGTVVGGLICIFLLIQTIKNKQSALLFIIGSYLLVIFLKGDLYQTDIERYLSVLYIPIVYLIAKYIDQNIGDFIIVKIVVVLWCIYPVARSIYNIAYHF